MIGLFLGLQPLHDAAQKVTIYTSYNGVVTVVSCVKGRYYTEKVLTSLHGPRAPQAKVLPDLAVCMTNVAACCSNCPQDLSQHSPIRSHCSPLHYGFLHSNRYVKCIVGRGHIFCFGLSTADARLPRIPCPSAVLPLLMYPDTDPQCL